MLIKWVTNEGDDLFLSAPHVLSAYVAEYTVEEDTEYIVCIELGSEDVRQVGSYVEKATAQGVLELLVKEVNKARKIAAGTFL